MAMKVALCYALLSALWILCSGRLLHHFVHSEALEALLEDVKGWFFVSVTAVLLGLALDRYFREIRRSTQLLENSEQRWQFALEGAGHGVWDWNAQTDEVFYSAQWKTMLGFEPHEIANTRAEWETRVHPEDLPRVRKEIQRHFDGHTPAYISEYRLRCKDGSFRWVLAQGKVISHTPDGKPSRVLGTHSDITGRKHADAALRESLLFRREAEKIARIGAWKVSPKTNYLYWTEGVYEIVEAPLDYKPGLEEGLKFYAAQSIPALRAALDRALEDGTPFVLEVDLTTMTGKHLCTEVRGLGRVDEGEQAFVMGTFQDITERKQLEAQFRQAQKLDAIGQLAGGVAHDFNNILAATMMHLGLLQMNPKLDDGTQHALKELDVQARRAASLTRQLLMFSRRSVLAVKPVDLNEVVANLLKMLRRLIGEHIDLRFDGKSGLPLVEADAGLLEQVLMNLVVNARDAMPRGGRTTISTALANMEVAHTAANPDRRPGRFVSLAVSDTGCGMDAATLKRIFEPFFTTKEAGRGTGLGLATVHGIVAQHKGWVEVESESGQGTTVRVFLPALAQSTVEVEQTSLTGPARHGNETILLVEDDLDVRELTGHSLRALGYRVHEAANGQEAMTLWQAHGQRVDLVLTDMVMPEGMTGLELAERLRALKPGLKVIIASGYSAEMVQAGVPVEAGVIYLPKPYATKALADTLRDCLDRKT